jgi:hypothetical protein
VVDEAVDHGGGDGGVAEDFAPASEGLVAGDDDRRSFVAAADELEEQVGGLSFEGDVADLVDDEERDPAEATELVVEASLGVRVTETGDPFGGGRERDAVAGLARPDRDPDREVRLAGAGGPRNTRLARSATSPGCRDARPRHVSTNVGRRSQSH